MYQSNQARAIISLGFPQGAGRPPNPSRHPVYCSTAGTVARQPPSLPPPQSSQSHLPPSPCATTAPRSRRARIILRPPSSHTYNMRPRLGRDPILINLVSAMPGDDKSEPPLPPPTMEGLVAMMTKLLSSMATWRRASPLWSRASPLWSRAFNRRRRRPLRRPCPMGCQGTDLQPWRVLHRRPPPRCPRHPQRLRRPCRSPRICAPT